MFVTTVHARMIAPAPEHSAYSAIRCASISARVFRWLLPRSCTPNQSSMNCSGSCVAIQMFVTCRKTESRSGMSGRTKTASWGRYMAFNGAAGPRLPVSPWIKSRKSSTAARQPGFAAHSGQRMERRRAIEYGVAAVPYDVSVICCRRQTVMPVIPTQCRYVSRRAFQHRFLCIVDAYVGAAD